LAKEFCIKGQAIPLGKLISNLGIGRLINETIELPAISGLGIIVQAPHLMLQTKTGWLKSYTKRLSKLGKFVQGRTQLVGYGRAK